MSIAPMNWNYNETVFSTMSNISYGLLLVAQEEMLVVDLTIHDSQSLLF
jgi:hypothetical protein